MNPHWESPPQDIIDAARKIVLWAEEHALRNWQIMGIGPVRSTVTQPVKEITVRLEKLLTIVETLRSIVGSLNRVAPLMGKLTFDQFGLDLENILSQGLEGCTKAVRDMLALVPEGDQSHGECRIGERPSVGPCIREDVLYVSSKGVLRLQYFDGLTWQWYHVIGPAAIVAHFHPSERDGPSRPRKIELGPFGLAEFTRTHSGTGEKLKRATDIRPDGTLTES